MAEAATNKTFLKLFVFDMSFDVTKAMLKQAFEVFGPIKDIVLLVDSSTNKSKGFGFIVFENPISALKAFESDVIIDVVFLYGVKHREDKYR